ncbi:MAG: histidine ammonia-lyase [Candidatus Xenobia bacterium]
MPELVLDGNNLTLDMIPRVARRLWKVSLAPEVRARLERSRAMVENAVAEQKVVYGINTGFGKLATVRIPDEDIVRLQRNLIYSHSAGVSDPLSEEEARTMMLLRLQSLVIGYSGVRPALVQMLVDMLNRRVHPLIPSRGSVGASGDLAPLAHLCLVMMGEGEAFIDGRRVSGREALGRVGLQPFEFSSKEGLATINGTQALTGLGALALVDFLWCVKSADIIGAMSLEALMGSVAPMHERLSAARPHPGQVATADNMRRILADSGLIASHRDCDRVQDAYSLRCIPQVHGAVKDMLAYGQRVVTTEMNSATDNPLLFPDAGLIISGGNFHGAPVALALDALAIAATQLSAISERRTYRLLDAALSGLPAFLVQHSGLNSGLMITQYTAASLVAENKVLAHPASVDSIPTGAGQEDHVSMGMTAALKLRRVVEHTLHVLGIELLCAAQALDFRRDLGFGRGTQAAYDEFRVVMKPVEEDRPMAPDIAVAVDFIRSGDLVVRVEDVVGAMRLAVDPIEARN